MSLAGDCFGSQIDSSSTFFVPSGYVITIFPKGSSVTVTFRCGVTTVLIILQSTLYSTIDSSGYLWISVPSGSLVITFPSIV